MLWEGCDKGEMSPCVKEGLPEDDDVPSFCMTKENEEWKLKRNHTYFYQRQLQMSVCDVNYGDFLV